MGCASGRSHSGLTGTVVCLQKPVRRAVPGGGTQGPQLREGSAPSRTGEGRTRGCEAVSVGASADRRRSSEDEGASIMAPRVARRSVLEAPASAVG